VRPCGLASKANARGAPPPPRQPDHAVHAHHVERMRQRADAIVAAKAAHVLREK
jgi:hypothetical protein